MNEDLKEEKFQLKRGRIKIYSRYLTKKGNVIMRCISM